MNEFRKNELALNSNTNLRISRHLVMIIHDAAMSVNSSICLALAGKILQKEL